jgi:peroxiredoxin
MRNLFFLIFLICLISCGTKNSELLIQDQSNRNFYMKGTVKGYPGRPYQVFGFYGFETSLVDSGSTDSKGHLEVTFPKERPAGLYRLVIRSSNPMDPQGGEKYLDFVFNYENIEFTTSYQFLADSLKILSSQENLGFYQYKRKQNLHERKMAVLEQFLFYYPEKDNFHRRVERQVKRLRNRHANYTENLMKKNEHLKISDIIKIHKTPRIPDKLPEQNIENYIRDHYFRNTDFDNPFLLRTPYLPEKTLSYISLFRKQGLGEEEQEEEYIRAIDTIMTRASVNEEVFFMLSEYLVNGFESLGMYAVSEYVTSQYILGGPCDIEDIPANLKARAMDIQKLAIGKPAPDFVFSTPGGKEQRLYDIDKEYTLLVFWTTTCPHCTDMIPRLKNLANDFRQNQAGFFEVIAISLDPEKDGWESFVKDENLDFIHSADFKGWESPVARLYHIDATPMLFLLDSNKNIVLKPNRMGQLERFLRRNLP